MGTKKKKQNKNKSKNKEKSNNPNKETKKKKRQQQRAKAIENFGKFQEQLSKIGLRIKEVGSDGNCLFRSVCDQIEGNETNHEYYRIETVNHMVANRDNFEPFIEDDVKFDDYIKSLSEDGTWGGNKEIQALSMRFRVNLYIHIFDHPMYVIHNFDVPFKSIHISYHDQCHYNSVRRFDDYSKDSIAEIAEDMISGVKKTSDESTFYKLEELENEDEENEDDEEETKVTEKKSPIKLEKGVLYKGVRFLGNEEKSNNSKLQRKIFSSDCEIIDFASSEYKKCWCNSKKKYKNCCKKNDLEGEFDEVKQEFYCDFQMFTEMFSKKISLNEEKINKENEKENEKEKEETKTLSQKQIYI